MQRYMWAVALLGLSLVEQPAFCADGSKRLSGGRPVDWPNYLVSVYNEGAERMCAAVRIFQGWFLTSARCVEGHSEVWYRDRWKTSGLDSAWTYPHPHLDVALLRGTVQEDWLGHGHGHSATLPPQNGRPVLQGLPVWTVGFGMVEAPSVVSTITTACISAVAGGFCTAREYGWMGSSHGDGGAPVLAGHPDSPLLIGIMSHLEQHEEVIAQVDTAVSVAAIRDWIREKRNDPNSLRPSPYKPATQVVTLGISGETVTLEMARSGEWTLNGEAFPDCGHCNYVTTSNGNTYALHLIDGSWLATYVAGAPLEFYIGCDPPQGKVYAHFLEDQRWKIGEVILTDHSGPVLTAPDGTKWNARLGSDGVPVLSQIDAEGNTVLHCGED